MIAENIHSVETRIQAACDRAGRSRSDVTLICVTKTMPVEDLQEAYDGIYAAYEKGEITEERIDESLRRIIAAKLQ